MEPVEKTNFQMEAFVEAGIPRDALVTLEVRGCDYAYGAVDRDKLAKTPSTDDYRDIAGFDRTEVRKFMSVIVTCVSDGPAKDKSHEFRIEFDDLDEVLETETQQTDYVVHSCGFSAWLAQPMRVEDILTATHVDDRRSLNVKCLDWSDDEWDPDSEDWVQSGDLRFTILTYTEAFGVKAHIFDALDAMQKHRHAPSPSVARSRIHDHLEANPEHWAIVAERFIDRFGRAEAAALIGKSHLEALLRHELWDHITAEPVEDRRQLRLKLSTSTSSAAFSATTGTPPSVQRQSETG